MKPTASPGFGLIFASFLISWPALAQDEPVPSPTSDEAPRIIGPVADGTPPPAPPPRELPAYQVRNTVSYPQGGRTITFHKVDPPDLPLRPEPAPAPNIDPDDPEVQAWLAEMREKVKPLYLALVSATVYDHDRTLVHWWLPGHPERSFEAWSNVDFNYLCGFGTFEVNGVQYGQLMGIGNIDTAACARLLAEQGRTYEPPTIPELPVDRPSFVLTKGDAGDAEGMAMIEGLHTLFANERDRLVAAYEGREQARKEREAFLKANPPQPQDITIHYWRKPNPKPLAEGGAQ